MSGDSDPASLTVGELARLAGVTVRTLHHYDEIGLLRPGGRTRAGYRTYGPADLDRLQRILAYRQLGFGLEEIAALLDGDVDPVARLRRQRELLAARIDHLTEILATLDRTLEAHVMGIKLSPQEMFEVFGEDGAVLAERQAEAQERWGESEAWRESQGRTSAYDVQQWRAIKAEGEDLTRRLAETMTAGLPADGPEATALAEEHRQHITRWFYDCSPQLHAGLAALYVADPRFAATYEAVAEGLARYVHDAILANSARG